MESDGSRRTRKAPKRKVTPNENDPDESKLTGTQKKENPEKPKPRRTRKKTTVAADAVGLSPAKPSTSRRSAQLLSPKEPVALKGVVPKAAASTSGKSTLQKTSATAKNQSVKKTAVAPGSEATEPPTDKVKMKILRRRGRSPGKATEPSSDNTDGGARTRGTRRQPGSNSRSVRGEKLHRSRRHHSRSSGGGHRRVRSRHRSRASSSGRSDSGKRAPRKRLHSSSKSSKRSAGRKRRGRRHSRSTSVSSDSGASKRSQKKIRRSGSPASARRKHGASKD